MVNILTWIPFGFKKTPNNLRIRIAYDRIFIILKKVQLVKSNVIKSVCFSKKITSLKDVKCIIISDKTMDFHYFTYNLKQ